ncbi:MAG: ABC transporter ATP-binding protein [Rhodobacteraceae bacterium]|nr:ABC transporter ATP-binding protein [Paracoccaceae bacterium]
MTPSPIVLQVRGLTVRVGATADARPILSDISFDLPAREILGAIGGGGSGKTTLARAIVNWLPPPLAASGEVLFEGTDVLRARADDLRRLRGRGIAYVGGDPAGAMDPTMTVGAQIAEKLRAVEPGVSRAEARSRVIDLLGAVRIPSARQRFDEYPFQYSGGMMQRAMIVDALIANPRLLVADSITQPLDVTVGAQILKLLRDLTRQFGTAVLFVSSSLPTVADVSDRVLVLEGGRLTETGPTAKVVAAPASAYTQRLIAELPRLWAQGSGPAAAPGPAARKPILSVQDVSKSYALPARSLFGSARRLMAVRNVTFDVHEGENFGVVGESGCGKSTLMRLLTALEPPDAGRITFEGTDIFGRGTAATRAFRQRLQLVLQDPYSSLPPQTSIGAIIAEPLVIHGIGSRAERRARALDMMGEVGLPAALYEDLPLALTAGQRQRVNVARAMILEPRLLIMDETLSALDQTEQARLLDLFEKLQAQHGFTYLFISHDIAMVRRVCARVAVMYLGEVVELAKNERLFFDPGHPYSRALLSAAPTLEARRYRTEDCLLEGEPPSPIDLPPGCAFATRCPQVHETCTRLNPPPTQRGGGDRAACHLLADAAERTGETVA